MTKFPATKSNVVSIITAVHKHNELSQYFATFWIIFLKAIRVNADSTIILIVESSSLSFALFQSPICYCAYLHTVLISVQISVFTSSFRIT